MPYFYIFLYYNLQAFLAIPKKFFCLKLCCLIMPSNITPSNHCQFILLFFDSIIFQLSLGIPNVGSDKKRCLQKHILWRYHVIRDIIKKRDVSIEQVPIKENLVDPFTKVLLQQKHNCHIEGRAHKYKGNWFCASGRLLV